MQIRRSNGGYAAFQEEHEIVVVVVKIQEFALKTEPISVKFSGRKLVEDRSNRPTEWEIYVVISIFPNDLHLLKAYYPAYSKGPTRSDGDPS